MSFQTRVPDIAIRIETALIAHLAIDPRVRELLGEPARITPSWPRRPLFPYGVIERHQQSFLPASGTNSFEHRIDLAAFTRHGGRTEARACLDALQAAFEAQTFAVDGVHIVLAHIVYADTMRTTSLSAFRGLLRFRILSEVQP